MAADNDNIVKYTTTIRDGVERYCSTCSRQRPIFRGETEGRELLTCCCFCQRVLGREPLVSA